MPSFRRLGFISVACIAMLMMYDIFVASSWGTAIPIFDALLVFAALVSFAWVDKAIDIPNRHARWLRVIGIVMIVWYLARVTS